MRRNLSAAASGTVFELVDGRKQSESDEADSEHIEESAHFAPRRGRASLLRPMTRRRYAFTFLFILRYPICQSKEQE